MLVGVTTVAGTADPADDAMAGRLARRPPEVKFNANGISGVKVHPDWAALKADGVGRDAPVTGHGRAAAARQPGRAGRHDHGQQRGGGEPAAVAPRR